MNQFLKIIIRTAWMFFYWQQQIKKFDCFYRKNAKNNGQTLAYKDLELAWLKKWSQFGYKVSNIQFRYFSNYIGSNINIVPEEISHLFIEPYLNENAYRPVYRDKNMFDLLLPGVSFAIYNLVE